VNAGVGTLRPYSAGQYLPRARQAVGVQRVHPAVRGAHEQRCAGCGTEAADMRPPNPATMTQLQKKLDTTRCQLWRVDESVGDEGSSTNRGHFSRKVNNKEPSRRGNSVRLHLQCFHRKAGFRSDRFGSFIAGWRIPPPWLRTPVRQVRAHGAGHGEKQRRSISIILSARE
jgi:hypothetical protein